ncbi:unnamed protein product, partial [Prorocentrum cordatum]
MPSFVFFAAFCSWLAAMAEFLRAVSQTVDFIQTAAQAGSLVGDALQVRLANEKDNLINALRQAGALTLAEATQAMNIHRFLTPSLWDVLTGFAPKSYHEKLQSLGIHLERLGLTNLKETTSVRVAALILLAGNPQSSTFSINASDAYTVLNDVKALLASSPDIYRHAFAAEEPAPCPLDEVQHNPVRRAGSGNSLCAGGQVDPPGFVMLRPPMRSQPLALLDDAARSSVVPQPAGAPSAPPLAVPPPADAPSAALLALPPPAAVPRAASPTPLPALMQPAIPVAAVQRQQIVSTDDGFRLDSGSSLAVWQLSSQASSAAAGAGASDASMGAWRMDSVGEVAEGDAAPEVGTKAAATAPSTTDMLSHMRSVLAQKPEYTPDEIAAKAKAKAKAKTIDKTTATPKKNKTDGEAASPVLKRPAASTRTPFKKVRLTCKTQSELTPTPVTKEKKAAWEVALGGFPGKPTSKVPTINVPSLGIKVYTDLAKMAWRVQRPSVSLTDKAFSFRVDAVASWLRLRQHLQAVAQGCEEELAEVRAAAARLDDRLAVLQATAEAVTSFWPLIWVLIGGLVKDALDRRYQLFAADGSVVGKPACMSEMRPGAWVITTPDGDRYPENLRCRRGTSGAVKAVLVDPGQPVLDRMRGRFYRFKDPLEPSDLVEQVKMAEAESYAITRRAPAPPAAIMMWGGADVEYEPLMASEGVQLVPLGGGGAPVHGEEPAPAPLPPPELPPNATWLIVNPHPPDFGRERHPGPDAPRAGKYAIALDARRRPAPVRQVALADVETFMASARTGIAKILEGEAGPVTGHLEERLHHALDGGTKTPPIVEDARTLTVDYDEHGRRQSAGENGHRDEAFDDVLYLSGCYDQLNGPSLARIETEEMEIESTRVRARGLQPPGGPGAAPHGAPVNPKGTPKGGGRGRGQPGQGVGQEGGGKATGLRGHLRRLNADVNATLKALNWMAGDRRKASNGPPVTSEQASVQARVRDRIPSLLSSGVAIPGQRAAFLELLHGRAVYDTGPGGHNLASFSNVASVSLPDSLEGAPMVEDVVGPEDRVAPGLFRFSERFDPSTGASAAEVFGICHYIYVDNLGVISCDPVSTSSTLSDASDLVEKVGLRTHDHEVTSGKSKALGTHLDLEGFRVSLSPARLWKVRQGVLCALRCRKLPRRVWEVLLGHLTFCAPINRNMMSVLRSIYALINKHYCVPTALWETARQEMAAVASLLFVMVPHKQLSKANWDTLLAGPWKYLDEGIYTLESRALLLGFQAVARLLAPGGELSSRLVTADRAPPADRPLGNSSETEATGADGTSDKISDTDRIVVRPRRRARNLELPRPTRPRFPVGPDRLQGLGLLPLESNAVKATAENQCHELVTLWRSNARDLGEPLGEAAGVDASVARQLQDFFDQGENVSKGEKLAAGLEHFLPEFGRHGGLHLSRSYRALRGWRRRCPPRSRRPLAFCIWAAISWEFCRDNLWNMAVYLLFMLVTYMRPSEPLKLLKEDLLSPAHGLSASWICFAFRQERGQSSKTYATDESIELSCQWAPFLATVATALKRGRPKEKVFSFLYSSCTRQFKTMCRRLGLTAAPYQARRSGASIDAAMKYRTRAEIKARGEWKADKSVLRYDRTAKIVESVDKLPDSLAQEVLGESRGDAVFVL